MANIKDIRRVGQDPTAMELGGRIRTIQFDLNSFGELENRFGSVAAAMEQLQQGKMIDIKTILWAGLIHDEANIDPITQEPTSYNITPYQVGGWIKNPNMLKEVSEKLGIAMGNDLPSPEYVQESSTLALVEHSDEEVTATIVLTAEEQADLAKNA